VNQKVTDCILQIRKIDSPRFEGLATSEGEEAPNQLAALFRGAPGHYEDSLLLLVEFRTPVEQSQAADYGR